MLSFLHHQFIISPTSTRIQALESTLQCRISILRYQLPHNHFCWLNYHLTHNHPLICYNPQPAPPPTWSATTHLIPSTTYLICCHPSLLLPLSFPPITAFLSFWSHSCLTSSCLLSPSSNHRSLSFSFILTIQSLPPLFPQSAQPNHQLKILLNITSSAIRTNKTPVSFDHMWGARL